MKYKLAALCLTASFGFAMTSSALANDITMKFTHAFPATHKQWKQGGEYLANLLSEASGGGIRFEQYPASQLGKETTMLIGSGLAEAGVLAPSYEPEKLPLISVSELPGVSGSSCEGSAKLWHLVKEGGLIDEAELKPLGVVAIYTNVAPQYSMVTTNREVTRLEDMQGLKIRANGAAMDRAARLLGAVPLSVTASEIFDSLSRGTMDGSFLSIEAVKPLGLDPVLHYAFDGTKLGTAATIGVVNRRFWEGLDEETKAKISEAGMATQKHFCAWYDEAVITSANELKEEGRVKINVASEEEIARWDETLTDVASSWAADLDRSGRPGTQVLEAYQQAPAEF